MRTTDDLEAKTIHTYDLNAKQWADSHAKNHWLSAAKRLKELLPTGRLLEIGCGAGRDAKMLVKLGFEYFGTDASQGMIAVARATAPQETFEQLNVYDLEKLKATFDGFWACNVLLHIPRPRISQVLTSLNRVLKTQAVGLIVIKGGEGEDFEVRDKDGRHEERLFVYWGKDDFSKVLHKNGFGVIEYSFIPVDERTSQHVFFVRKQQDL